MSSLLIMMLDTVVPYPARRKIKYVLHGLFIQDDRKESVKLLKQLSRSHKKKKNVYVFGITTYDFRFQRPQHLVQEMIRAGYRVFYIEPEFVHVSGKNAFHPKIIKKNKHLFIVRLASRKNYFIYSDKIADPLELQKSLSLLKSGIGSSPLVMKIDHPGWYQILRGKQTPMIYDCMDEHSGFSVTGKHIPALEKKLMRSVDVVLAASQDLMKKSRLYTSKPVIYLPNAGEYEHFKGAIKKSRRIPSDILHIKKPIIGYYGAIEDWFDDKLYQQVFERYTNCSFILIGKINNTRVLDLAKSYKNVFALGEKKYSDLPDYLSYFDICTIPFRITPLIRATHPVKFFEYAAAGKPVVTTALSELSRYRKVCYYSKTRKEFIHQIDLALRELDRPNKMVMNRRMKIAKRETWKQRGRVLNSMIRKYGEV